MKYRLLALDLDGTLLGEDRKVSAENAAAIADAHDAGVLVVPCTGRGWRESVEPLANVPHFTHGIFNTGAVIVEMDSGKAIDLADFEPHLALELVEYLRDLPEAVLVYQEYERTGCDYLITGDGAVNGNTAIWLSTSDLRIKENRRPTADDLRHSLRVGVVATGQRAYDIEDQVIERFADRTSLHCFAGVPTTSMEDKVFIVEIFAAGVSKWRGLQWLAQQHGITDDQIAVMGDEVNDLPMLESAGLSIAMANAVEPAKQLAHHITRSNADHGVAYAIRQMLDGAW